MNDLIMQYGSVVAMDTIWRDWGAGLCATEKETDAKWKEIASNPERFNECLWCFFVCMLNH